jgi:predicted nucleotidyltransferase
MAVQIPIDREAIASFCRRNHIRKLAVFGSATREDFGPASDIDFLVEFEPEHVPGLMTLVGMEMELAEIVGRRVDMRTAGDRSPYFRDRVVASAHPLYVSK